MSRQYSILGRKKSAECQDYILPQNCSFSRHESDYLLNWSTKVENVLIVRKDLFNDQTEVSFRKLSSWLLKKYNVAVYVESQYHKDLVENLKINHKTSEMTQRIIEYIPNNYIEIDIILTLGGDGTLLKASAYFPSICPPIMAYNLGTLGFLAPFCFDNYKKSLKCTLDGNVPCVLRNRLSFNVQYHDFSNNSVGSDLESHCNTVNGEGDQTQSYFKNLINDDEDYNEDNEFLALNEVVIDRGSSNHMLSLIIEVNKKVITKLNGDGLIISTPTGSTAYSLAAGASIIHPAVRGILLAPINPFSLSMRPIFLPVGVEINVYLNPQGRLDVAHLSFDGNGRQVTINKQQWVSISVSRFPIISVCESDQMTDWFNGLHKGLNWNKVNGSRSVCSDD